MTKPPGVVLSPWVWQSSDFKRKVIRITVSFDNTTKALTGASVFRDATCVYTKVYLGIGADNKVESSPRTFVVPAGTTNLSAAKLSSVGLNTIDEVLALQITAGP